MKQSFGNRFELPDRRTGYISQPKPYRRDDIIKTCVECGGRGVIARVNGKSKPCPACHGQDETRQQDYSH